MDPFAKALAGGEGSAIPPEYDWFAPMLGDWTFDYYDGYGGEEIRHVRGEWLFRRVLEGAGIEDVFICPSRETRKLTPQPDAEYGAALRMFNAGEKCYDMVYACAAYMVRLRFVREGDCLVGTPQNDPDSRWVFSEIAADTFHWQNVTVQKDGSRRVNSDVYAKRAGQ